VISPKTVSTHVQNVLARRVRVQAVALALHERATRA
jgi:DNA-binding CsgD family transcriptional regulator